MLFESEFSSFLLLEFSFEEEFLDFELLWLFSITIRLVK
jgi:hypothetical protein